MLVELGISKKVSHCALASVTAASATATVEPVFAAPIRFTPQRIPQYVVIPLPVVKLKMQCPSESLGNSTGTLATPPHWQNHARVGDSKAAIELLGHHNGTVAMTCVCAVTLDSLPVGLRLGVGRVRLYYCSSTVPASTCIGDDGKRTPSRRAQSRRRCHSESPQL